MKYYDVIVIGGGGAGLSAAFTAAGFGKKTLLVEKYRTGGECTWNGCIPSKALIHLAELAHASGAASDMAEGGPGERGRRSIPSRPFARVDAVRNDVYSHESPEVLAERGVETLIGRARFTGADRIDVNGEEYRGGRFVLAVGSRALVPRIPGLEETPYLTNESLFDLKGLPGSAVVMGGGPIGLEMAQALCRLGVRVTVVEMLSRILFREDPDAARVIEDQLTSEGITILTGAEAVQAAGTSSGAALTVRRDGNTEVLKAEALLIATGRASATGDLNLEAAGVKTTPKGVAVDKRLRTSNPRIYAAGDAAGPFAFSHMAEYQGVRAALNIVLPFRLKTDYRHVAWTTFTDPEIASAGLSEKEARERYGGRVKVFTHRFEDLDRGRTAPGTRGLVKIILDGRYRVLGAHIAGPRAGELICEVQVLKTLGIGFHKLSSVIHPYPVYADILRQIAKKAALERLMNLPPVRLVRMLRGS